LTAIDRDTRLFISHKEGPRDANNSEVLFQDIEDKRDKNSPLPVFVSDNWDPFEDGLLRVYGIVEIPEYCGIGRPPKPQCVPPPHLKYAQIIKKRKRGEIVESIKRVVYGDESEVWKALGVKADGVISTSYVERLNLTIRNSLARFIRKGMNFSKNQYIHRKVIDFYQGWYNFCKPHTSLRILSKDPNRKWQKRTPAIAAGITDHVWSLNEMLTYRVPIHP
jgi:hypothetical protein